MPERRRHRGPHPEDEGLFAPPRWEALRQAVHDLSWLLTRGYAEPSSLKLVGDRFDLRQRQRIAVNRAACSDQQLDRRRRHAISAQQVRGRVLWIDGFNVLTSIEAALAGGVLLRCRDGCLRDMASMHGSYRKVHETGPAIEHIGEVLAQLGPERCEWLLDRPVSNSGRLATMLRETAEVHGWPWQVELVNDPDALLIETQDVAATADSGILDRCAAWFDLAGFVLAARLPDARPMPLDV